MKRLVLAMLLVILSIPALSQDSSVYEHRYNMLISKLGLDGVGVETLLEKWEAADSLNPKVYMAGFDYWFTKSRSEKVVSRAEKKYLGMSPVLSLKDSTGTDVFYYREYFYDDLMYGNAIRSIDKAIRLAPDNLGYRFAKANAYIAYEKGSPDMTLEYLESLSGEFPRHNWTFEGQGADADFLADAMQEYCYSFYSLGTPESMEAFHHLSGKMMSIFPDKPDFQNNIGAYYLVGKSDYKKALKQYTKVLKKFPTDYTAMKNCATICRMDKNVKQELKYLRLIAQYGPEDERAKANARITYLEK